MSAYNEINYYHLQTLVKQRRLPREGKSQQALITALEKEDNDGRNYAKWDRRLLKKEIRARGLGKGGNLSSHTIAQRLRKDDDSKAGHYKPCPPFRKDDEADENNDPDLDIDRESGIDDEDDDDDDDDGEDDDEDGDDDSNRNDPKGHTDSNVVHASDDEQKQSALAVGAERRAQKIESDPQWPGSRDASQSTAISDTSSVFSDAPRSTTGVTPAVEEITRPLGSKRYASHSPSVRSDQSGQPHRQKRLGTSDDQHSVMSLDEVFHPGYENREIEPQGDVKLQQKQDQSLRDTTGDTIHEDNETPPMNKNKKAMERVNAFVKGKTAPSSEDTIFKNEASQEGAQSHKYTEMPKDQLKKEVVKRRLPVPRQNLPDDAWAELLRAVLRVDDFHRQGKGRGGPTSGMPSKPGMSTVSETDDPARNAEGLPRDSSSEEPRRTGDDSQPGSHFSWKRYFLENPVTVEYDPKNPHKENPNRPKEGWAPFGPFENAEERWVNIVLPETHEKVDAHIHSLSNKDQLIVEFPGTSTKRQSRGAILPANEVFLEERDSFRSWCADNHHHEKLIGRVEDLEALDFGTQVDKDNSIVCSVLSPKVGSLRVADTLVVLRLKNIQLEKHWNASGKVFTRTSLERRFGNSMKIWILKNRVDHAVAKGIMMNRRAYKDMVARKPLE